MTRGLYALAWAIAAPFALARLLWRSRRQPGYRAHLAERLGRYAAVASVPRIWVHAVSLGETHAAAPLVRALMQSHPQHRILLTHMTPTGRAAGEEIFGDGVERCWLPYDLRFATRRFLAHFRPEMGVLLETEIWPRLLEECARAKVPVVLANARLSERSARRYARWPALARWGFGNLAGVAAQTGDDARRFAALGARRVVVMGNVKFDIAVPEGALARGREFRGRFGAQRRIWVAGSTREGEEALLLDALAAARFAADVLLVIVPRHPQRFDAVAESARKRGLAIQRRSDEGEVAADTRVMLGDSMGEMLAYYAAADVAIMGGSLLEFGSQNLIEPCAMGTPVIVGPHTWNFAQAAEGAIAAGAAVRVSGAAEALARADAISADRARRDSMGAKGLEFVAAHRGAVDRFAAWLEATLRSRAA